MGHTDDEPGSWEAASGGRLDRAVSERLGWSRSRVRLAVESGRVRLGEAIVRKAGAAVRAGQPIVVESGDWLLPDPGADLTTLAADPAGGWVVLDKPAGQAVHPLRPDERGTLLQAAAGRFPELLAADGVGREGPLKSGVVHRIDAITSGCVVLARTVAAWDALRVAFAEHRVAKTYLARVAGRPEAGALRAPMAVVKHRPARAGVVAEGTATSMAWTPLSVDPTGRTTLIRVELETGFFHQVRAGMAHLGHPVAGDWLYGGPEAKRVLLHAWKLSLPELGLAAVAPPPAGLQPPA